MPGVRYDKPFDERVSPDAKPLYKAFARALDECMRDRNINQKDFAMEFHVSEASVSNYLCAKALPSCETLVSIAEYFDVSVGFLLGKAEKSNDPDVIAAAATLGLSVNATENLISAVNTVYYDSSFSGVEEFFESNKACSLFFGALQGVACAADEYTSALQRSEGFYTSFVEDQRDKLELSIFHLMRDAEFAARELFDPSIVEKQLIMEQSNGKAQ